jgi:Fur family ferric uptake transcriptional regulator
MPRPERFLHAPAHDDPTSGGPVTGGSVTGAPAVAERATAERRTRQRAAIRRALEAEARPLAPAELLAAARRDVPQLGIATVYRTLRALVDDGLAVAVELPGEPARYERTPPGHHHHFRCRTCARVFEVPGCASGIAALVPAGFELDGHDLVLYGRCGACAA